MMNGTLRAVRLTSLTLHGFKSFGERTTLEFSTGVTAIVGPNGSGKSNLVEALRWATGGGRASEYRAGEKTDLIFHGASAKRGVSYAEVELELLGEGRRHAISRSLFRDGSSRLKLDGKSARFLDLDERLAGTGLGRGNLAIIGQGEVGQVLMASPEKLLDYVAEATGVARLTQRREQAEARFATANEHLERLQELEQNLAARVEALRVEAAAAERYAGLAREILRLRYTLALHRKDTLAAELTSLQEQDAELAHGLDEGRAALGAAQARWHEARGAAEELERRYRDRLADAEARRGDARVAAGRVQAAQERAAALAREAATIAGSLERLAAQTPPQPPADDLAALTAERSAAAAALAQAEAALRSAEAERTDYATRFQVYQQQQVRAEQARADFLRRKTELEDADILLAQRLGALEATAQDLAPDEARLDVLESASSEAAARLDASRGDLEAAQRRHAEARAEAEARRRALLRARQSFEARSGYAQGPKQALSSGLPGVLGSVADVLRVPPDLRAAVGAALGRRAEYIVVDTADTAQAVIAFVRGQGGWVTVLPLELLSPRPPRLDTALARATGVLGLLTERVEVAPRFAPIRDQLMGNTTLVETMAAAVALARRFPERPRFITLDGSVVENYGALSGGRSRGGASVIGLAADLEDAEAALQEADTEAEAALRALQTLQEQARAAQQQARETATEAADLRARLVAAREAQAVAAGLREEVVRQRDTVRAQLGSLLPPELPETDEDLAGRAEAAARATLEARQAVSARAEAARTVQQALAVAEERWHQYRDASSRFGAGQAHRRELEARQAALGQERARAESEVTAALAARAEAEAAVPDDLDALERGYREARSERDAAEAAIAPLAARQAERAEAREAVRLSLARRETALEAALSEVATFPEGVARLELSARTCRERLAQAEAESADIGPVNHRALTEVQREGERLETLAAQRLEAVAAVDELATALARIERETTARLNAALHGLRERFAVNVRTLFGEGAHADIAVARDEGRPAGLSIALQPPGKQTQALSLLSVGERTMGAMAFLFSLMQGETREGLPIAILDEVDAPLDEANIRRFCGFLSALARQGTQFVLVTHQKATFDVADVLWGVTSDRGVSRVFSIRREDAEVVIS